LFDLAKEKQREKEKAEKAKAELQQQQQQTTQQVSIVEYLFLRITFGAVLWQLKIIFKKKNKNQILDNRKRRIIGQSIAQRIISIYKRATDDEKARSSQRHKRGWRRHSAHNRRKQQW
jgi:hypothetical protein